MCRKGLSQDPRTDRARAGESIQVRTLRLRGLRQLPLDLPHAIKAREANGLRVRRVCQGLCGHAGAQVAQVGGSSQG